MDIKLNLNLEIFQKRILSAFNHKNVSEMFKFSFPPHFLSANAINNSMFLPKRLTIDNRFLDNCSLTKTIVNKLIFVIIKRFFFSKALGAWWNW